jgi:hypothetical protein
MQNRHFMLGGLLLLGLSGTACNNFLSDIPRIRMPVRNPERSFDRPKKDSIPGDDTLASWCRGLQNDRQKRYLFYDRRYRMSMYLRGIYVKDGYLFFRLYLANHSGHDYPIDRIRFLVRTDGPRPQPAIPVLPPIRYVYGDTQCVRGRSALQTIIVMPAFTLPRRHHLLIQVIEKNGSRHLQALADNRNLIRARHI